MMTYENRLFTLAGEQCTEKTRAEILQIATKFGQGIELDQVNGKQKKTIGIYKNLLRDFRIYFNEQYCEFLALHSLKKGENLINSAYFPILMREFVK